MRHSILFLLTCVAGLTSAVFAPFLGSCSRFSKPRYSVDSFESLSCIQNDSLDDALFRLLREKCPQDVPTLRKLLHEQRDDGVLAAVSNRGYHNIESGSLSFFEAYGDSLYVGFFAERDSVGSIALIGPTHRPSFDSLVAEAIAWDSSKGWYNFYELRGGRWHYRGDTADVIEDVTWLHRDRPSGTDIFGRRLRCSGCHLHGAPIMKERQAPHNDWWTKERKFYPSHQSKDIQNLMAQVKDASLFSDSVDRGMERLVSSSDYRELWKNRSQTERLRPLFCPMDLELVSAQEVFQTDTNTIHLPSEAFIDPRLGKVSVSIEAKTYGAELAKRKWIFAEANPVQVDTDHPYLIPAKSFNDRRFISMVKEMGMLSDILERKVLSIDQTRPAFSDARCRRLRKFEKAGDGNMPDTFFQTSAPEAFSESLSDDSIERLVNHLSEQRDAIKTSEVSQNPRGQILEPGFRIIFPEPRAAEVP